MYRRLLLLVVLSSMAMCLASTTWAQHLPGDNPPVRQTIGLLDTTTSFATATEATCRNCHSSGTPDRHHVLYNTTIPAGTTVPFPVPGQTKYTCYTCHGQSYNPVARNCTLCHGGTGTSSATPHHGRPDAVNRKCSACHGSLVADYNDGHYIPTYAASMVTPKRSITDAGWYDDGTHALRNTGGGPLKIPVGSYNGNAAGSGLFLVSTGVNNDIAIDHTSRNATASMTFTVVVNHNAQGNPTPTAAWSSGGGTAGTLTIGFESGVTTAAAMIAAINALVTTTPPSADQLRGSLPNTQGEGTLDDPTLYSPIGGLPLNNRGFGAGACNYCHDADEATPAVILDNHDTHHGINLPDQVATGTPTVPGTPGTTWRRCNICHDYTDRSPHLDPARPTTATYSEPGGPGFALHIRICEECHSLESLHNIQADSDGNGMVPGAELAGFGHVGRDNGPGDSDCWGCHGFEFPAGATTAPFTGPIIPTVFNADASTIPAGKATMVVLSGAGFTNQQGGKVYDSDVRLTAADGSSVTLEPDLILDEGNLAVTIPATTRPGNYNLQATKGKIASNPAVISITPKVSISRATYQGRVTILGSGFAGYAQGSTTSVTATIVTGSGRRATTRTVEGKVVSWTDTKIVADFGAIPQNVTVNSVFGTARGAVSRR